MTNKMTYVQALTTAINSINDTEAKEKLDALRKTIEKRKSGPSKKKIEAMQAKVDAVYEALLCHDEPVTVSELIKGASNDVAGYSLPQVTALLTKLCASGKAVKTIEKRKSYYAIAE